jgi:hypothetical protein
MIVSPPLVTISIVCAAIWGGAEPADATAVNPVIAEKSNLSDPWVNPRIVSKFPAAGFESEADL